MTSLPSTNSITSFGFSNQVAITTLAAEYCTALVQNSNSLYTVQQVAALGSINLKVAPSIALTAAGQAAVIQALITKFWGTGYATSPDLNAAQLNLMTVITDLVTGAADNSTTTVNAVIGVCTAVLASSPANVI